MTRWNGSRLAAGIAAALMLGGTALAQGTGSSGTPAGTGTEPSDSAATTRGTPSTPGGSDTAVPSRSDTDTAGSTGTATGSTGSTGTATGSTGTTTAPGGSTASGDPSTATQGAAATASAGKVDKGLEQGLQKLHAANQAEIQMGQMAAQSAQDPQVKQFAQQMVDDHQKNDQQLEQLAQQAGVTLQGSAFDKASKQSEEDMGKLHGKSGADFDQRYMSHMVKDHQKDVKDVASLAKQAHKAKQTELASFLDQTHSAMQGHLEQAKTIEKASKGERHGRRGAARPSSGMSTPPSGTGSSGTGTSTGSETNTGSSGATAPSDTGSPGAEQQPRKP